MYGIVDDNYIINNCRGTVGTNSGRCLTFAAMPMKSTTHLLVMLLCALGTVLPATAQDSPKTPDIASATTNQWYYDTDLLPASFHEGRREALRAQLPDSGMAAVFAYPVRNRSNDVYYEYHPNPDLYYFTGYREPHSMVLIFKEPQEVNGKKTNELLVVQPRDKANEVWNGKRLGVNGAEEFLAFEHVMLNNDFANSDIDFSKLKHFLYLAPPGDMRDNKHSKGDLASLVKHFERKISSYENASDPRKLKTTIAGLREVKLPEEIALMRKAIDITCMAQEEMMQALQPDMHEYECEAIIEFVFKREGAEHPGFPSILGGGENSCTLHYVTNRKHLHDGEVLVADIGAEYHGYTADVTRTMPVNGTFSEEQTLIYNLVLAAQKKGIAACKPGNRFWAANEAARGAIASGLKSLGITKKWSEVDKYFMHGTSHYLGLDVHDAGNHGDLEAGNVLTVEPGIYIPEGSDCDPKWWNIGVRIEDDILITKTGYENLSDCVVKTIPEIEAAMAK